MAIDFSKFQVIEDEDYADKIPSLKDIALMHIKKISDICCQEFTPGYWEEKPVKVGGGMAITKTYHPDSRAVFCNAIDFLTWIVYPYADAEFKEMADDSKDEIDIEEKIKQRKKIFKAMNLMFDRLNFFDSQRGRTEISR